jgi:hypothetical protein
MQINMGMLEISSNGHFKPIALFGQYKNSKGSVLDDLSSSMQTIRLNLQYAEKSSIVYDQADYVRNLEFQKKERQSEPVIGKIISAISDIFDKRPSPPDASEIFKDADSVPGWRIKLDLAPLFKLNVGDAPALLVINLLETADPQAQKTLMDIVTGKHPTVQLGKNVIVAFAVEPSGLPNEQRFHALINDNCTVFDMAPPPQPGKIPGLTTMVQKPDPYLSGLPEYVETANKVSDLLAAPKLISLMANMDQAILNLNMEKLERFVTILGTLEGGAYGAEAISRGVDRHLLEALVRIPQAERCSGKLEGNYSVLSNKIVEVVLSPTPVEPEFVKRGAEKSADSDSKGPSL